MVKRQVKYERIDENRVKRIEIYESEIRLDELEAEIENLRERIENLPKLKTEPDQETLDFWNEMMITPSIKEELEEELREKEELLKQLKGL